MSGKSAIRKLTGISISKAVVAQDGTLLFRLGIFRSACRLSICGLAYLLKSGQKLPGGQVRGESRWFNFLDLVS